MIAIEKGIPIPNSGAGRTPKYPWRTMEVGDSFFAENVRNVSAMAAAAMRRTGLKFTVRKVEDGHRIWRVA